MTIEAGVYPSKRSQWRAAGNLLREMLFGFGYWLAFVLVLEPGNIMRTAANGQTLDVGQEAVRLIGAGLLGALSLPPLLQLARRYPAWAPLRWRRLAVHAAGCVGLAVGLVALSCVLADIFLVRETRPLAVALRNELTGNGPLVLFSLIGLDGLVHAMLRRQMREAGLGETNLAAPAVSGYLRLVTVKKRGHLSRIDLHTVDWIGTEGNYLALHVGGGVHLLRETMTQFEAKLDPALFVRIHRQTIVAIGRVTALNAVGGGDADVTLQGGVRLRVSRSLRRQVEAALARAAE